MFDTWLKTTLQRHFDQDLDEPLSKELTALLAEEPEGRTDH